jgi:aspartate kinase
MEQMIIPRHRRRQEPGQGDLLVVPDTPGVAARIFKALAAANINVDMIVQNVSAAGVTDVSFTVAKDDINKTKRTIEPLVKQIRAAGLSFDGDIAKVSLVGVGMKSHSGVAYKMFDVLAANKINIEMISTSEIKISVAIRAKDADQASARCTTRSAWAGPRRRRRRPRKRPRRRSSRG